MNINNKILPTRDSIKSLAGTLEIPRIDDFRERYFAANDLLNESYEEGTPAKSLARAREAFENDPFLSDALLQIARLSKLSYGESLMYLHEALRISASLLEKEAFIEKNYPFWLDMDTRPFMRALHCLGIAYHEADLSEFAEFYLSFALDLNPNDNQGIRYLFPYVLISLGKLSQAREFIERWNESSTSFLYTKLLIGLLEKEDSDLLEELWQDAYKSNAFVPDLLSRRTIARYEGPYRMGDEGEACAYIEHGYMGWRNNRDALHWLESKARSMKKHGLKRVV